MKQFNGPSTKSQRRYRLGQERFDFQCRNAADCVTVPFESVEIRLYLADAAA